MTKKTKAIIYMLLSTFSFSVMQIIVKASATSVPVFEQVFARNLVTALMSLIIILRNHEKPFGKREHQRALLMRSGFGYLGVVGYFYAAQNMVSADAAILHRSSPFFVTLFAAMFLKEKLSRVQIMALFTAAIGAVLVVRPQLNSAVIPAVIALLSAVAAGAAYTSISYLKGKESNACIIFYFSMFSVVASFLLGGRSFILPDTFATISLLAIGVFAGVGQILLTKAYKMAKASEVSIFNYSGVIFAGVMGAIIFNEKIEIINLIGMLLIISAALAIYFKREKA